MNILLVEDDLATRTMLAEVLIDRHYQVDVAGDGRSALELAQEFVYDTIVLDINIPEIDGISLCKMLRAEGCQTPILLLTAKDEIFDRVMGLDAGADDYAIKPFNVQELLARIRALVRRGKATNDNTIATWERLQLNCLNREVRYDDRLLRLTPKEYGILELLLLNPYRIFSRATLISRLWELETAPTESVINSHIKSIRQKLKTVGATEDPIETIYGFGYRLRQLEPVAPVEIAANEVEVEIEPEVADALMLELWTQFKDSFIEQIDLLATTARTHTATFPNLDRELGLNARDVAHKLAGSLGVYGFPHGSVLARQIEDLFNHHVDLTATDLQLMTQLVSELQREIEREPILACPIDPAPTSPKHDPPIGTIWLVDDDPAILQQLSVALSPWGWEVVPMVDPQQFWERLSNTPPIRSFAISKCQHR